MVAPHPPAPRDLPGRLGTGALLRGGGEPRYRHRHRQCPAAGGSGGTGPGLLGAAVPLRAVPGVGRQLQPRSAGSGAAPPLPAVLQRAPDPRCRAMAAPRQRDGYGGTELATTIACGIGPPPSLRGEGKVGQSDSCCKYQGVRARYLTSSLMEREACRDLSASVPGSVPGCLCLHARAGWAQQHAFSQPCASPRAWHGHPHTPSPHTLGLAGGPATAWHSSVRGSGAPGAPGDIGFILYPAPAGFCSPSPLAGWLCSPAPRHVPTASARASPCPTDTRGLFPALLPRQEVSLQAPVTFEDVEVRFSAEEWELLEEWQRALHREVTEGTSQLLASLGPPSSPALGALVQLVKEIPKFLFGGPKAGTEPGATSSRDAAAGSEQTGAGVKTEAPVETCPLRSLEKCLEELVMRGSGHPATPSPPASGSRAPGERQRGEPSGHQSLPGRCLLRGLATPPGPSLAKSPAAPAHCCPQSGDGAGHPGSLSGSSFASSATREPAARAVAWGWDGGLCHSPTLPAAGSAGQSPLQGLLDCLRDIATPKPIPAWPAAAGRRRGAAVPGTGGCSVSAAGVTAPAVPPRSPAKTRAVGTRGTAVPGDTHPARSTRPPACPPRRRDGDQETLCRSGCRVPTGVWHASWQLQRGEPAQEEVPWNEPPIPTGGPR
ncbi:protein KRBA1 [Harpia harpyja]|uniref:protein KRBA1 n=1 Tax=Harpia harpyja TaxID=202280 RepID=UPI0022B09A20|nr:protein KRBA1 [Harpia harpyja]